MLKLTVIDDAAQHFVLTLGEPARVEVTVVGGRVIAHVYRGTATDLEQEPDLTYDGLNDENGSYTS